MVRGEVPPLPLPFFSSHSPLPRNKCTTMINLSPLTASRGTNVTNASFLGRDGKTLTVTSNRALFVLLSMRIVSFSGHSPRPPLPLPFFSSDSLLPRNKCTTMIVQLQEGLSGKGRSASLAPPIPPPPPRSKCTTIVQRKVEPPHS